MEVPGWLGRGQDGRAERGESPAASPLPSNCKSVKFDLANYMYYRVSHLFLRAFYSDYRS